MVSDVLSDMNRVGKWQKGKTCLVIHMSFASSPAGKIHGISGPIVHQLVQVICECALPAGGYGRRLCLGSLAVHCSPNSVCAAGP